MLTKQNVQAMMNSMPDTFSLDDIVERLLLINKIEIGLQQVREGETMDWENVKKEMDSWFE